MKFLLLLVVPFLLGIPIYTNALGIDENYLFLFLILLACFLVVVFKKVQLTKNLFWLWAIPLTSLLYAHDRYLSNKYYIIYAVYLLIYLLFKEYSKPLLVYKVIVWYSVLLMLYVLYQTTVVFPYLLTIQIDEGVRNLLLSGRQFSTFQLPNAYAAFSCIVLFLSLYLHKKEHKFYYFVIALLNLGMLVLTKTFIAFALLIVYAVFVLLYRRRYKQLIILSSVIILFSVIFFSFRAYQSVQTSLKERAQNYEAAILMYMDHPLLGVGDNNFDLHYPRYQQKTANVIHNAHSYPLQSIADHGVFGFLMIAFFIASLFRLRSAPLFPMFILIGSYFMIDLLYYFPSIGGLFWLLYALNEPKEEITTAKRMYAWSAVVMYAAVIVWFVYFPPERYLQRVLKERTNNYEKGLYYSGWLKTIELEEYRYND